MKIQCPNCNEPSELTFEVDWHSYACPNCQTLYYKESGNYQKQTNFLRKTTAPISLYIGQQGVIEGVLWEVGGVCIKYPITENIGWQEYTLYSKSGEVCYLSEYNGFWTLSKEIENDGSFNMREGYGFTYKDSFYQIFHNSRYRTSYAAGFFDHQLPETGVAKDFISPPKGLLLEQGANQELSVYEARFVPEAEMEAAFPDKPFLNRYGPGMLEPFGTNLNNFWSVLATVGGLVIFIQLFLAGFYPTYPVMSEYVVLPDSVAEVTHLSPSFTCTDRTAPVQIKMSAPVDNSWAAVDFCLVNEATKEERFGSVDVAYYHGYEGGESWSEGDMSPSIKICGVEPGPYHLVMQIAKQPNSPNIKSLRYEVFARASTMFNMLWALGLLLVSALIMVLWKSHFDHERWMKSDFPPASDEEE